SANSFIGRKSTMMWRASSFIVSPYEAWTWTMSRGQRDARPRLYRRARRFAKGTGPYATATAPARAPQRPRRGAQPRDRVKPTLETPEARAPARPVGRARSPEEDGSWRRQ